MMICPVTTTTIRSAQTSHSPNPHAPKASPGSDSPQEAGVKGSRSTEQPGVGSTGGSTANPVSQEDRAGTSEEGGDPAKRDPNAPASEKRASVEKEGQKPLDPADK